MTSKNRLAAAHRLIAQAMGVPQLSVDAEHKLTRAALEGVQIAIDRENQREVERAAKELRLAQEDVR